MVNKFPSADFSISTKDFNFEPQVPECMELENDEAEMYSLLFNEEIGAPIEVRKPLQRTLRKFVDKGLLENDYYRFVELCHKTTKNQFDSVKKNGLHVINNEGDVSLICAETNPEWKVICTLKRGTIEKFYKNKNFGYGTTFSGSNLTGTTTVRTSGGGGGGQIRGNISNTSRYTSRYGFFEK